MPHQDSGLALNSKLLQVLAEVAVQYLLLPVVNSSQASVAESKSWKCGFELSSEECALNLPGEPTFAQLTIENDANCQRRAELRHELEKLARVREALRVNLNVEM